MWPHLLRVTRWQPLLVGGALAAVLSRAGRADPELRALVVAVVLALGAAFVFDDAAAVTLASSPSTLRRRRAHRLALVLPTAAAVWALVLRSLSWTTHGVARPGPATLAFATMLAVTFAIAAMSCGPHADLPGGAVTAPTLLALVLTSAALPRRFAVFPVAGHERRWWLVLAASAAVVWVRSADVRRPLLR